MSYRDELERFHCEQSGLDGFCAGAMFGGCVVWIVMMTLIAIAH